MQGEMSMTNIDSTKPYTQSQKVQNCLTLNTQICLEKERKALYIYLCKDKQLMC